MKDHFSTKLMTTLVTLEKDIPVMDQEIMHCRSFPLLMIELTNHFFEM